MARVSLPPKNVGIKAMEIYFPHRVYLIDAKLLEVELKLTAGHLVVRRADRAGAIPVRKHWEIHHRTWPNKDELLRR